MSRRARSGPSPGQAGEVRPGLPHGRPTFQAPSRARRQAPRRRSCRPRLHGQDQEGGCGLPRALLSRRELKTFSHTQRAGLTTFRSTFADSRAPADQASGREAARRARRRPLPRTQDDCGSGACCHCLIERSRCRRTAKVSLSDASFFRRRLKPADIFYNRSRSFGWSRPTAGAGVTAPDGRTLRRSFQASASFFFASRSRLASTIFCKARGGNVVSASSAPGSRRSLAPRLCSP